MKFLYTCIVALSLAISAYCSPTSLPYAPKRSLKLLARGASSVTANAGLSCSPTNTLKADSVPTNFCTCNNGDKRPYAPAPAGSEKYTPCPATTASPVHTADTKSGPIQFKFTTTDPYGEVPAVIACETSSVADFGASPVTMCAGKEVVLTGSTQLPPHPTLKVTAAQATSTYVGSLTGAMLYASVTSALSDILPRAATPTNYKGGTATISGITYPDGDGLPVAGDLEITVDWAQFQNGSMHESMIQAAALAVNQTAHAHGACREKNYPRVPVGQGSTIEENWHICQVAGAYNLEYFDGVKLDGATDFLGFSMEFKGDQDGEDITEEICETIMTAVDFLAALAAMIFPPAYLVDETAVKDLVQAGCELAKDIENGVHQATSII